MTGTMHVPSSWSVSRIAEVLEVLHNGKVLNQGKSPQCEKEPSPDETVWGVLKTTAIQAGAFLDQHNKRLPDRLEPDPSVEVRRGDLLITCAGPRARCGVPCLVRATRQRLMLSGKMYRFRADESRVRREYLEYFLLSPEAQSAIDRMKTGTSESGLNLTHARFSELSVPVPTIEEQSRIVELLDEHLSRVDAVLASAKTIREKAARFRRSLLHATFGPEGSDTKPLRDVATLSLGKMLDRKQQTGLHPTTYLRNINVRWHSVDLDDLQQMDVAPEQFERVSLQPGDLVVCEGGEPGRAAVWEGNEPIAIQKALHRVRPHNEIDSKYLSYLFESEFRGSSGHRLFTGTTIKHLPKEKIAQVQVPMRPLEGQLAVVLDLDAQLSSLDAMLTSADTVERRCAALRRSLLHAAVTGKLTEEWREIARV